MPYIKQDRRKAITEEGRWGDVCLRIHEIASAGELNYAFTIIALAYLKEHGFRYDSFNDIYGAMSACKLELNRRHLADYEDEKIKENGDVD